MHTRTLGQGLNVSAVGFGCMGMAQSYGPKPGNRPAMINLLGDAVELGATFFDTAESYGPFHNENRRRSSPPRAKSGRHRHQIWLEHPRRQIRGTR